MNDVELLKKMLDVQVLKRTADVITDKLITIEIDVIKPTLLDRILRKPRTRVFSVRRACLATLLHFANSVLNISTTDGKTDVASIIKAIAADGELAIKIMAILIDNTDKEPSAELMRFIRYNFDETDKKAVLMHLISHSRIEDFMSSIILMNGMSLLKTEEMIASEQSTSGE